MNVNQTGLSCCQRCRFYTLQGRRGGYCNQLNAPVQAKWAACTLAAPVFMPPLTAVAKLSLWQELGTPASSDVLTEQDCLAQV